MSLILLLFCMIMGLAYNINAFECYGSGSGLIIKYPNAIITPNNSGQLLTESQTTNEPNITWNTNKGRYFHLIMIDPDAPSPTNPTYADYLHWFIINNINNIPSGYIEMEYKGPSPPLGIHRYCVFIYETHNQISYSKPIQRNNFNETLFSQYINTQSGSLLSSTYFNVTSS